MRIELYYKTLCLIVLFKTIFIINADCYAEQMDTVIQNQKRNPIILVHGIMDTEFKMATMAKYLRKQGFEVYTVTLKPSSGQIGIDSLAMQLKLFIDTKLPPMQSFDLVGFSMGGIICRYYLQRLNGKSRINHLITISSPHNGTITAYLSNRPASIQMRPNSKFINNLNSDFSTNINFKFTSIWTPTDLMIVPSWSSKTKIGKNIAVFSPLHPMMVKNKRCLKLVEQELM